jgi:alcohol dehydrogenase
MDYTKKAEKLLYDFKGDSYLYGRGVLNKVGKTASGFGKKCVFVRDIFPGSEKALDAIRSSLEKAGVIIAGEADGAKPNCPREDLYRITEVLKKFNPDVLISFGGGSTIDAVKAAEVLRTIGGDIEDYFGMGKVTEYLKKTGKKLTPHIAVQSAASSGAHLTKYSNITDVHTGQKKLIVDEAIVPQIPVFDYEVTYGSPKSLTMDGALDGIAHCLEVLFSAAGKDGYERISDVAESGIGLVVENLQKALGSQDAPGVKEARDKLCLATDMGGYAIMLGGTNGGHLTSFSLVDLLSHGRACAIMNPYYTVFFAPAIEQPLRMVGKIYKDAGFTKADLDKLKGRELGVAVAEAMFELSRRIDFPVKLADVKGFSNKYIERALEAAKNPQLEMKLKNMPVPLTADMIDKYMGPILESARDGDLGRIINVK